MLKTLQRVLALLEGRERRQLWVLLGLLTVRALIEALSVASIMPFLALAADPGLLERQPLLRDLQRYLALSQEGFLLLLGGFMVFTLVLRNGFLAYSTLYSDRFVWLMNHRLSERLLRTYLARPYSFFLTRNSSDLSKTILTEVGQVTNSLLLPLLNALAKGVTAFAILSLLIVSDPFSALLTSLGLGGAYALLYTLVRGRLRELGAMRLQANRERYLYATEAFGSIRDAKLMGREEAFVRRFSDPSRRFSEGQATAHLFMVLPAYALEALAVTAILLMAFSLIRTYGSLAGALPLLGLYAFGAYRLMPALQGIYSGITGLRYNSSSLDALIEDLQSAPSTPLKEGLTEELILEGELSLHNICYSYPGSSHPALDNVSLTVSLGSRIGIIGQTGSGKTTLLNVLLGLLEPQSGTLTLGGQPLQGSNLRAYQRQLGYVPQSIYLTDGSIASNIALGLQDDEIDYGALERALRLAALEPFVKSLPDGTRTRVGERGVSISGGQMQRLALARALYADPPILILDEATGALDSLTEREVLSSLRGLGKTIITVTHRLGSVRDCEKIVLLEDGRVSASGSYDSLLQSSPAFRRLATASSTPEEVY